MNNIVTNMAPRKKFWEEFPIAIILDEMERKKKEQTDHREQLHIQMPPPRRFEEDKKPENEDGCIIIKFM
jgi:hypothetical protein